MVRELVKNFSEISVYHLLTDSLQDSNKDGKSSLRKIWKFGKCWLFSILLYLSRSLLISSSFLGREDIDAVILNSFFHLVFFLNLSSHLDPSPCSKTGLREIHVSQIIVQDFHLWILWGYWEECYLVLFITIPSVFFFPKTSSTSPLWDSSSDPREKFLFYSFCKKLKSLTSVLLMSVVIIHYTLYCLSNKYLNLFNHNRVFP